MFDDHRNTYRVMRRQLMYLGVDLAATLKSQEVTIAKILISLLLLQLVYLKQNLSNNKVYAVKLSKIIICSMLYFNSYLFLQKNLNL